MWTVRLSYLIETAMQPDNEVFQAGMTTYLLSCLTNGASDEFRLKLKYEEPTTMVQAQEIAQKVDKLFSDPTSKKSFMPTFPQPSAHPYPSSSARPPHHLSHPYSQPYHQDFPPPTMQPQHQPRPQAPFPQPRPQAPKLPNPPHHASGDRAINGIVKALNDLQLEVVNMRIVPLNLLVIVPMSFAMGAIKKGITKMNVQMVHD